MESIDKNSLVIKQLGVYLAAPNSEYIGTPINGSRESELEVVTFTARNLRFT